MNPLAFTYSTHSHWHKHSAPCSDFRKSPKYRQFAPIITAFSTAFAFVATLWAQIIIWKDFWHLSRCCHFSNWQLLRRFWTKMQEFADRWRLPLIAFSATAAVWTKSNGRKCKTSTKPETDYFPGIHFVIKFTNCSDPYGHRFCFWSPGNPHCDICPPNDGDAAWWR